MKLRSLFESVHIADSVRSLTEGSTNDLSRALEALSQVPGVKWALIGGLAVGFRSRPRGTQDIDVIVASELDIEALASAASSAFRHNRGHSLEHKATGVEVEVLTPEFLKMDPIVFQKAINSATMEKFGAGSIPVVDTAALIVFKLNRASRRDQGDIEDIITTHGPVDLSEYDIPADKLQIYQSIVTEVQNRK